MSFYIAFGIFCAVLAATVLVAIWRKSTRLRTMLGGACLMLFVLQFPLSACEGIPDTLRHSLALVVRTIQVLSMNEGFALGIDAFLGVPVWFGWIYLLILALLWAVAPLLTVSVVLSMFGNASARLKWLFSSKRNVYVFSCINERTVKLAESLSQKGDNTKRKPLLIMCDNRTETDESITHLNAVRHFGDITNINSSILNNCDRMTLLLCGDDEYENVEKAEELLARLNARKTKSRQTESEQEAAREKQPRAFRERDVRNVKRLMQYIREGKRRRSKRLIKRLDRASNGRVKLLLEQVRDVDEDETRKLLNELFTDYTEETDEIKAALDRIPFESLEQKLADIESGRHSGKGIDVRRTRRERGSTDMLEFPSGAASELLLNSADKGCVNVKRVDEKRAMVYDMLLNHSSLFETAPMKEDGTRHISVLISGSGSYGTELMRALVWSCRREGYFLTVNIIDRKQIKQRLELTYPELFHTERLSDAEDIKYKINIIDGVDLYDIDFGELFAHAEYGLEDTGLVFISMGGDMVNIEAASYLNRVFARRIETKPVVQTVVYDLNGSEKRLNSIKDQYDYSIELLGGARLYSKEVLLDSVLEKYGAIIHRKWNKHNPSPNVMGEFYNYEYNYRSTLAVTLFWLRRIKDGCDSSPCIENAKTEHSRWNAYVRSEGYIHADKKDSMAKTHTDLIKWDMLPEKKKKNDFFPIEVLNKWEKSNKQQCD